MLISSLCDYSDLKIFLQGKASVQSTVITDASPNDTINKAVFKNCIREICNTQKRNVKDTDVLMPVYNLLSGNYSKTSESLFQYYKNEPLLGNNSVTVDVNNAKTSGSFKFKKQRTGDTGNNDTINVKIIVALKYHKVTKRYTI